MDVIEDNSSLKSPVNEERLSRSNDLWTEVEHEEAEELVDNPLDGRSSDQPTQVREAN